MNIDILGDEVKEGDIRLVGGSYLWHGRVEIFLSGVWGTMTYYGASSYEAEVICRQLGYNTYCESSWKFYNSFSQLFNVIIAQGYGCCARFGEGTGPIHLTNPLCSGYEYRLTDCDYSNDTASYSHSADYSVFCYVG